MNCFRRFFFGSAITLLILSGCGGPKHDPALVGKVEEICSKLDEVLKRLPASVQLAPAEDSDLARLQDFVNKAVEELPSESEAKEAIDEFEQINAKLSPEAQHEAVERLLELQWNLEAIHWLTRKATGEDEQREMIYDADALLEQEVPERIDSLLKALESRRDGFAKEIRSKERELFLVRVQNLDSQATGSLTLREDQLLTLQKDLEGLLGNANSNDEELAKVQKTLAVESIRLAVQKMLADLEGQMQRLPRLSNPIDHQTALNQLLQRTVGIRVALVLDGNDGNLEKELTRLDTIRNEITKQSEEQAKRAVRQQESQREAYQSWALGEVVRVRQDWNVAAVDKRLNDVLDKSGDKMEAEFESLEHFPDFRKWINDQAKTNFTSKQVSPANGEKLGKWLGGITTYKTKPVSHRAVREAVVKWLLPIDTRFLDQPVAEIYNQTWAEIWESLEGSPDDHRLAIARASVTASKRTLDSFPSK